jgi:hypothetical protein
MAKKTLFPRFPRFPRGPRAISISCPQCDKENTLVFAKFDKYLQLGPDTPIAMDCGCTLPQKEIFHQLQNELIRRRGVIPPESS